MTKAKHGICIAALLTALAAPSVWADDSAAAGAGILEALLAHIEALWLGDVEPPPADVVTSAVNSGDEPELGPAALPNG